MPGKVGVHGQIIQRDPCLDRRMCLYISQDVLTAFADIGRDGEDALCQIVKRKQKTQLFERIEDAPGRADDDLQVVVLTQGAQQGQDSFSQLS